MLLKAFSIVFRFIQLTIFLFNLALSLAALALNGQQLAFQILNVLQLVLAYDLAFLFGALQVVDVPPNQIRQLLGLDKFLLLDLNVEVEPLNFVQSLCNLVSNLITLLFYLKINSLMVVNFLLKLCDILLLSELFLVFGLSKLSVALS